MGDLQTACQEHGKRINMKENNVYGHSQAEHEKKEQVNVFWYLGTLIREDMAYGQGTRTRITTAKEAYNRKNGFCTEI